MNPIERTCRSLVLKRLKSLTGGTLSIVETYDSQERVFRFGRASDLDASINVRSPKFFKKAAIGGGLGFADSLVDGDWDSDDLTSIVRIFIRDMRSRQQKELGVFGLRNLLARCFEYTRRNTKAGSKRNIHQHYDLSNKFFSMWLDPTMTYSCGLFRSENDSMHQASINKIDMACSKLDLQSTDHLVEIGTGWGALAIHAAKNYGCRVTTTTISNEQYELARQRIADAGLSDRIEVLQRDYRDLGGKYDKLVSIEMIEAVGHSFMANFFTKCNSLLKQSGLMLLQGITIVDQMYRDYVKNVDFIRKYIFPGGCLISTASLLETTRTNTQMRLLQLDDMAPHYAETLRRWRQAYIEQWGEIKKLGFDDRFDRMWRYYLSYCEAAFEERQVNVQQFLFAMPQSQHAHLPLPTRSASSMGHPHFNKPKTQTVG